MKNTKLENNNLPIIDGIVIVEGKTDSQKLKSLFNVTTIETNGLNLTKDKLEFIKELSKTSNIILFLDPDGPGEKIRKKIVDNVEKTINVFISKKDINFNNNSKIGVAEAFDNAIIESFKKFVIFDKKSNSISWDEYLQLGIDSKIKREIICNHFNISMCNNKQLFKRLNMMNIKYNEIEKVIKNGK